MRAVPLGDVAQFINGVAFKPEDWHDSGLPIIRIQNLTDPTKPINLTNRQVDDKYKVRRGDILVSWSATLGVFIWERTDEALVNQHIFRVLPDTSVVDPGYLKHILQGALGSMERHLHGATMKHVNRGEFLATEVPLPPLDEQRRIAAILDKADGLITARRKKLAFLEALASSIFVDIFGEPVVNPEGWELAPLQELCTAKGKYGASVPSVECEPGLPRYIRITDIGEDGSLLPNAKSPGGDSTDWEDFFLRRGDILFARSGATVGKTYLFRGDEGPSVYAGYLIRFCPKADRVRPEYIYAFTRTESYRGWVKSHANVVAQPNINARQYGLELLIPVPPLDLQDEFVRRIAAIQNLNCVESECLVNAQSLAESLASRAFAGEL